MKVIASSDELILAKEMGMRFPEKYKKSGVTINAENVNNFYDADIYYFLKRDDSFNVSYLAYWNGKTFRGGYICYRNHYTMAGSGIESVDNGVTIYPDDTREIRGYLKRFKQYANDPDNNFNPDPSWYMFNFSLYDDLLHFWGIDSNENIDLRYSAAIEIIMGSDFDSVMELFNSEQKNRKPAVKYIAVLPVFTDSSVDMIVEEGDTISRAWKNIYETNLKKNEHIFLGINDYHRRCHYAFRKSVDNYKEPVVNK